MVTRQRRLGLPGSADLSPVDRIVLRIALTLASALFLGLVGSGVWLLVRHEPAATWSSYSAGSIRPIAPVPSGVSAVHAALGDLAGVFGLLVAAWVSYRLIQRISWSALAALGLVVAAIVTGTIIRFNATITNGVTDATTAGYRQVLFGEVDLVVTNTRDLGMATARAGLLLHMLLLPLIVVLAGAQLRRMARRRAAEVRQPGWIELLRGPRSAGQDL